MPQGNSTPDCSPNETQGSPIPGPQISETRVSVPDAKPAEPAPMPEWTGCRYAVKAFRFRAVCLFLLSIAVLAGGFLLANRMQGNWRAGVWWASMLLVAAAWIWFLAVILYRHWTISYRLDHERLLIKRGLFLQTTDSVLIAQINDIKKIQTLADRLFNGGVGTVVIYSSDSTDNVLSLKAVDKPSAAFEAIDYLRKDYVRRRGIKSFSAGDSGLDDGSLGIFR